jgi:enamine deaminase RidA (YjgF/YER057c/UK114 family)
LVSSESTCHTAVQVPRLFRPEFLVEIEAIAVVKKN